MLNIAKIKLKLRKLLLQKLDLSLFEAEAEINKLLKHVFGFTREEQELNLSYQPTLAESKVLAKILKQRLKHTPLQYLIGFSEFYGLQIKVNHNVLIPRPETEVLVEEALKAVKNISSPRILEIGTGSGCISLALAKSLSEKTTIENLQIYATDISNSALEVAEQNAKELNLKKNIHFVHADILTPELLNQEFDLLVSNPPYISGAEYLGLAPEVKREPCSALVGLLDSHEKDDGLACYRKIANLKIKAINFLLELDPSRAELIKGIFQNAGYSNIRFIQDFNGFIRFIYFQNQVQIKYS